MQDFLKQNAWNFLIILVGFIVGWTTLNNKVAVIAQEHQQLDERLEKIENLTEQVIILQQHDIGFGDDLSEIKDDLKEIKKELNIR